MRKISKEPESEKITIKLDEIIGVINRLVDKVEGLDKRLEKREEKFDPNRVYGPGYRPRRPTEAERNNPPKSGTGESIKRQESESTFFCGLCPHCEVYIAPGFMIDYENPFCPACGGDVYEFTKRGMTKVQQNLRRKNK